MGGVELSSPLPGRKTTGPFLRQISNRNMSTSRQMVEKHVRRGSTVWTDGHASYNFLNENEDYEHDTVIHRRGQFSKRTAAGVVSTNA
eukprot:12901086-Prorocentrum_lima.AAC.1